MLDYKLKRNQIDFFKTFGFILLKGLFLDKIEDIIKSFEERFLSCKQKNKKENCSILKENVFPSLLIHTNI